MRRLDLHALAHRRLLAIDLGARYIGLAARASVQRAPFPCGLIERAPRRSRAGIGSHAREDDEWEWVLRREEDRNEYRTSARRGGTSRHSTEAEALAAALAEHDAEAAVVGMPYHADGSRSRECSLFEKRVAELQAAWRHPVPVLFWDESFTTRLVTPGPRPPAGSKAARSSHALAACLILEEVVHALAPLELGHEGAHDVEAGREDR